MTDDASYPATAASGLSKASSLCGGTSVAENWRLLQAEVHKSKLLRSASDHLAEFIWPQDERPSVPHNDFQGAEELPILDLCNLHHQSDEHPSSSARDKIARDLVKILSDWGFVQLVNHGVDTQVIQEMQAQAKKFFDLPLEQKDKAKVSPGCSSSSSSSSNNKHEAFGYGVESGFYYDGKPWIDRFQCRWSPAESITELADKVYCEDAHEAEEFRLNSLSLSLSLSLSRSDVSTMKCC
jgi:gibberellin 20-oxidase